MSGFPVTTTFTPAEFCYNQEGAERIPIMVASGQTLVAGTVMGQVTTGKLWKPYASGNSDGTQTPWGILAENVDTSTAGNGANPAEASMYIKGKFILANLVSPGVDASALTARPTWTSQTATGLVVLS
jgi:hypothetical protein